MTRGALHETNAGKINHRELTAHLALAAMHLSRVMPMMKVSRSLTHRLIELRPSSQNHQDQKFQKRPNSIDSD